MEETSHSVWVNSEALKRAGLTGLHLQAPIGGEIMLNAKNEANGILLENAGIWILDFDPELKNLALEGLKNGLSELAYNGITSFVDARYEKLLERKYLVLLQYVHGKKCYY